MPGWFWLLAVCVVLLLILNEARKTSPWFAGLVSRGAAFLSPLGALGARLGGSGALRLLAVPLVIGAVWGVVAYIEGRGADRERIKDLREDVAVAELQGDLERKAGELGIDTHRDRARVASVIAQAEQEITDAVEASDFDLLYLAYRRAYDGVWFDLDPANSPDSNAGRASPVRRSAGDNA